MTFSVVDTGATRITVMPKPISVTDAVNLSLTERAYGNVSGSISDNDSVVRLNTDTAVKSNLFFDKIAKDVLAEYDNWCRERETEYAHLGTTMGIDDNNVCLLYTSPSPRDRTRSRMPSSA